MSTTSLIDFELSRDDVNIASADDKSMRGKDAAKKGHKVKSQQVNIPDVKLDKTRRNVIENFAQQPNFVMDDGGLDYKQQHREHLAASASAAGVGAGVRVGSANGGIRPASGQSLSAMKIAQQVIVLS